MDVDGCRGRLYAAHLRQALCICLCRYKLSREAVGSVHMLPGSSDALLAELCIAIDSESLATCGLVMQQPAVLWLVMRPWAVVRALSGWYD